jgi:dihydrofolate synthase/folylpolyglutamate synthase
MQKIIHGVHTTRWDGRLEKISNQPLVLLDGAHNEEGAYALRDYIKEFVPLPLILVFAAMRDKKIERMASILFPLAKKIILTSFPYFRAFQPEELMEAIPSAKRGVICEPDAKKAFRIARELAGPSGVVIVTGSLFLVGAIKKISRSSSL